MAAHDGRMPPVMILCGGKGTRLREVTELLPKPMVSIGERPILWHIMKIYASFGVNRFILCLGYKREAFVDYFLNYHLRTGDATITLGREPEVRVHGEVAESGWQVTLAGTGEETMTGLRVFRAAKYLSPEDEDFFLTYGDGVADIDIGALYKHHLAHDRMLTVSAVHPEARFGEMRLDGDRVTGFEEKPPAAEGYINGGFMVAKRGFVQRYLDGGRDEFLEQAPMARCVADGEMRVYRHDGFWQCMDNRREYQMLNRMWAENQAPWTKYWE